jgi:hypothetical protein
VVSIKTPRANASLREVGSLEIENHLLGAYSYASNDPVDFSGSGILQTGAWNYLREEITVALIRRRAVRMGQIFDSYLQIDCKHVSPCNSISYLLAKIVNFGFEDSSEQQTLWERRTLWRSLRTDLDKWEADLPHDFAPFSHAIRAENPFPSIWLLQPYHGKLAVE